LFGYLELFGRETLRV